MVSINGMYNSSLKQFQVLFNASMTDSRQEPGEGEQREQETSERVLEIIEALKMIVYKYISRGLFEKDKIIFKMIISFKMMLSTEVIKSGDISLFLKAGDLFDKKTDKIKPPDMEEKAWKNILALSEHRFGADSSQSPKFFQLPDKFTGESAKEWMAV